LFCKNCGKPIPSASSDQIPTQAGMKIRRTEAVSELDIWKPILFLFGIIFLGMVNGLLGLVALVGASAWVYYDAKKYGVGGPGALVIVTFLAAIVGLPLYAYRLHQLRKGQILTRWLGDVLKIVALIFLVVWIGSLLGVVLSYVLLYRGETATAELVAMVSTGTLVLTTILLIPLAVILLVRRLKRTKAA
jgi:hypothetical protein